FVPPCVKVMLFTLTKEQNMYASHTLQIMNDTKDYLLFAIIPSIYLIISSRFPLTLASRSSSDLIFCSAPFSTSSARSFGMTTTPSTSPTIISPGLTEAPPHEIGTFVSPGPVFPPDETVVPLQNTGKFKPF